MQGMLSALLRIQSRLFVGELSHEIIESERRLGGSGQYYEEYYVGVVRVLIIIA